MKFFRWIFISALSVLILIFGALLLLQSRWTKDQLAQVIQEIALQAGVQLSIEQIEGKLPLKWTFTNLHATFGNGDTIDIDKLQVRIALLPLLRGHLGISYMHAGHTAIASAPPAGAFSSKTYKIKGSFSVRSAIFDEVLLINRTTREEMLYHVQGRGKYSRGGLSFFVEGSLHSEELGLNLFCEGSETLDHLQTQLELSVRSQKAFAPFYYLPTDMAFNLKTRAEGSWQSFKSLFSDQIAEAGSRVTGELDLNMARLQLPSVNLEPQSFRLSSQFSLFANRGWSLSHLAIVSPGIQLQGSAEISPDGTPVALQTSVKLPNLSYFSPHLKGSAHGELELHDEKCYLLLAAPEFTVQTTTFKKGQAELLAQIAKNKWNAALQMEAQHPTLGYRATSELSWFNEAAQNIFEIKSFDLVSNIGRIAGDLVIQSAQNIHGGLNFQITDLSPLSALSSWELAGQVGGEVQFTGDEAECRALGKHLKIEQFISNRVVVDISHVKFADSIQGALQMTSDEAYLRDLYFSGLTYSMGWNGARWNYFVDAKGDWKGKFDILSRGELSYSSQNVQLICRELSGTVLDKHIMLKKECQFELSDTSFALEPLELEIEKGQVHLSSSWDQTHAALTMQAEHFPLDFLTIFTSRFSLKGMSSVGIDLKGSRGALEGNINFLLEHADIFPAGSTNPIQTKGSLQAHIANHTVQLHSHLVATDEQLCDISLTSPIHFELHPLKVTIPEHTPLAGSCTIEGHTEQLFDFINLGSQRVGGFLSCNLLLGGTINSPIVHGPLTVQGGFYENYFIGIAVKDADITAQATGRQLIVEKAIATDGEKGSSNSTAVFYFKPHLPFSVKGTISHFRVIRFDWLTGACSGPFTIDGDLKGALAKGNLSLDEADVTIPDQLPSELPTLPITFINEPPAHIEKFNYSEPYPFRYDLTIHGDHDLRLQGRGIEADLEGDIHLAGKNLSVIASGALHTRKGKFSFAGKDFIINQGEILFSDERNFLNITSTVDYPNLTVTVHFRGDLKSPQLIFESNPSLPTSAILARILFNKDVSELSAGQAVQLANTIVTLAGSSGPTVLESIRKNLGIDRLNVSVPATKETGYVAIEIGKYITEGVLISLIQSTKTSQVRVEVQISPSFALEAETQEDNQGKFSFKWNKNY